ncbi:MAG: hypothetical protein OCC45_08675 [Desulfotalea sp.]
MNKGKMKALVAELTKALNPEVSWLLHEFSDLKLLRTELSQ